MKTLEGFISFDDGKRLIHPPKRHGNCNSKYSRCYNNNNIFTLDTETTSILYGDKKCSFVYIAMLSINGVVYQTRDLQTLKKFFDKYDTPKTINVVYVHNLGFDFTFLQNVLEFDSLFARTAHKPIFARYKSWEFRCSYFLSQMSLENVAKSYNLEHGKLTNGLDYRKIRHMYTEMTETEYNYCEYDCLALHDFIKMELDRNGGKFKNIPYTQTGYVRKFIRENAVKDKEFYKLRDIVESTIPDMHLFNVMEKCFTGGYTHANYMAVASGVYTHVKSFDFTSSYPAVMCRSKFPMGKFRKIIAHYDKYIDSDDFRCVGLFKLKNLHARCDLCYLSKHKCFDIVKPYAVNNGRIFEAKELKVYLTDIDIHTLRMMYDDKLEIEIVELYASKADYLPKTIVKSILELYGNKTIYKGVKDKAAIYLASKQMVNSVYGMSVFNPFSDEIEYDNGNWKTIEPTYDKLLEYYHNRKTILPYQWGIFVTAYARFNLCNIAVKIGNDVLYMDTDSIKFIGNHDELFQEDDAKIHNENVQAAEHFGFNPEVFAPVDVKGKSHELGLWDYEGEYKSFKVLGAKRYAYTYPGDARVHVTCAGANIRATETYLMTHGTNALLRGFALGLRLDSKNSGKNSIYYHDNYDIDIPVRDYLGNTQMVHIGYGAYVEPTTFDMSLSPEYYAFMAGHAVSDKKVYIRRGVIIDG